MKMKKNILLSMLIGALLSLNSVSQINFNWAKNLGSSIGGNYGISITVDATGNVFTTGYFSGTVDFDPGPGVANLVSPGGAYDVFITKFDPSGTFVWAVNMGNSSNDGGYSIAVDAAGNVFTTGYFQGTVDFDPGPSVYTLSTVGGVDDIFICKLDVSGNFLWAKSIGDTGFDVGNDICVDAAGNVYTTGYFEGVVDFDPGAGVYTLTSAGSTDIFVSKLDASGNFVFAKNMGGAGGDAGNAITLDGVGNIYVTGPFMFAADFDPSPSTFNLNSWGQHDIFVSKLNSQGDLVWAKQIGGPGNDYSKDLLVDPSGNIYSTGQFESTVDFDTGIGTYTLASAGSFDVFLNKLDATGSFLWAKRMGGVNEDRSNCIAFDANFNVHAIGFFEGTNDFDPGAGVYNLTSAGPFDVFIWKLDVSGLFNWARRVGGAGGELGNGITIDGIGNLFATGSFANTVDFDPSTAVFNISSYGPSDIFILKYCSMATPTITPSGPVFFCQGGSVQLTSSSANSYSWNTGATTQSILVSTSGLYSVACTNTNGCTARSIQWLVTNYTLPNINVTSNYSLLCIGETASLVATGAVNYTWSNAATGSTTPVSPTVTTNYTVNGIDVNGCQNSTVFTQSVISCIGIKESNKIQSEYYFFPNPNNGEFKVQINTEMKKGQLAITNALGQIIYESKVVRGVNCINISLFPKGFYNYLLFIDERRTFTGKLSLE
jgi:hypothetical protein